MKDPMKKYETGDNQLLGFMGLVLIAMVMVAALLWVDISPDYSSAKVSAGTE
jgi:hypothetical protein